MLRCSSEPFNKFIKFLNDKNFTDEPCWISVVYGFPALRFTADDGRDDICFAVYFPEYQALMVAADPEGMAEEFKKQNGRDPEPGDMEFHLYANIAHEYIHHLQKVAGKEFDEEEAEKGAHALANEFMEIESKITYNKCAICGISETYAALYQNSEYNEPVEWRCENCLDLKYKEKIKW
jgi:hypothetical protein